jgi:hypothetical protein
MASGEHNSYNSIPDTGDEWCSTMVIQFALAIGPQLVVIDLNDLLIVGNPICLAIGHALSIHK